MEYNTAIKAIDWIDGRESDMTPEQVRETITAISTAFIRKFSELYPGKPVPRMRTQPTANIPSLKSMGIELPKPEESRTLPAQTGTDDMNPEKELEGTVFEQAKPQEKPAEGSKDTQPLKSETILEGIIHISRSLGQDIKMNRAQLLLYIIYGRRLAFGNRLDIEHPQAWKYGPVFPRAYNKCRIKDFEACREAFEQIEQTDKELAGNLRTIVSRVMSTPTNKLVGFHTSKDSPYGITVSKEPGNWGVVINDEDICKSFAPKVRN